MYNIISKGLNVSFLKNGDLKDNEMRVNMRKIKPVFIFLIVMLVITTLLSCREKPIAGPVNVKYDYKTYTLHWDKVDKATRYVLDINGMFYESLNNEYSFREKEKGLYKVKIKAIFKQKQSVYSNFLTFVVSEYINLLIYSDGDFLYWEEVDDARYEISYLDNLSLKTVVVVDNKFLIPKMLKNNLAEITLKVFVEDRLLSEQKVLLDYELKRVYKNSPLILRIYNADEIFINGKKEYGISIRPDNVRLSPSLISKYNGEAFISISGKENILKKILILPEPFELISFYIQPYLENDVKYEFSFKNYKIKEILGLTLGADYQIEALKTLVIKQTFIERVIRNNPSAEKIVLKVTLIDGNKTEDIYLEIDLN